MIFQHSIGIIQGRLSRPVGERIQAFPAETWQEEFALARDLGLDVIEWIFEEPYEQNPLWQEDGRKKIRELARATGVKIEQICADYFMQHPFFRGTEQEQRKAGEILSELIALAKEVDAKSIEIPLLDNSRIETDEEMQMVVKVMREALKEAAAYGLTLAYETSLTPAKFAEFLSALDHPAARGVYDIGNSASLGYDPEEEIKAYGKYLSNVHVKDRLLGGSTVPLGTGNADFAKTFQALKSAGYQGPFTLQVARGQSGREAETTRSHLEFLNKYL